MLKVFAVEWPMPVTSTKHTDPLFFFKVFETLASRRRLCSVGMYLSYFPWIIKMGHVTCPIISSELNYLLLKHLAIQLHLSMLPTTPPIE